MSLTMSKLGERRGDRWSMRQDQSKLKYKMNPKSDRT